MIDILSPQMAFTPEIVGERPATSRVVVVGGMGGSAFPVSVARYLGVQSYLIAHRDYDLPKVLPEGATAIALSYSGETEETLSFARAAREANLPLAIVTSGGTLLAFAQEHNLPYVAVPSGFVPRDAIFSMTKALLALLGESNLLELPNQESLAKEAESEGKNLASALLGKTPVFYSSTRAESLSYLAKIMMNETAKVPAFSHVLPEANHNELQGYGPGSGATDTLLPFTAVFLRDATDDPRILKRMDRMQQVLGEVTVPVLNIGIQGDSSGERYFYLWWLVRTAAGSLAETYGVAPDATPLIDRFKEAV